MTEWFYIKVYVNNHNKVKDNREEKRRREDEQTTIEGLIKNPFLYRHCVMFDMRMHKFDYHNAKSSIQWEETEIK